jgi:mono/diheme cytochrome c family protein
MKDRCDEGLALGEQYVKALLGWGSTEVNRQAAQLIPVGPAKQKELAQSAKDAEAEHFKARHTYVEHIANCVVCSRKIVAL